MAFGIEGKGPSSLAIDWSVLLRPRMNENDIDNKRNQYL